MSTEREKLDRGQDDFQLDGDSPLEQSILDVVDDMSRNAMTVPHGSQANDSDIISFDDLSDEELCAMSVNLGAEHSKLNAGRDVAHEIVDQATDDIRKKAENRILGILRKVVGW